MKFFAGFMVGTISGAAIGLFQSKDAIPSVNDTKLFQNIKDFKDILADLQKNVTVVPEVITDLQKDLTDYTENIKPDVEELQSSIQELKTNLNNLNKG